MESFERFVVPHDKALKYSQDRDYEAARRQFEQILRAAEADDDQVWELHSRWHVAVCYLMQDRYDLAVGVLEPALDGSINGDTVSQVHDEITFCRYVLAFILLSLPGPLNSIERAIWHLQIRREPTTFLGEKSPFSWHRFYEARLLRIRGLLNEARAVYLSMLTESTADQRAKILLNLAGVCIDVGAVGQAKRYLDEWDAGDWFERDVWADPDTAGAYRLRSRFARLTGRPNEALRMIRLAEGAREGDDKKRLLDSYDFVRAEMAVGDLVSARRKLAGSLSNLYSPRLETRFLTTLLAGDFRVACVRERAGMEPFDYELGVGGRSNNPKMGTEPHVCAFLLDRARLWYRRAECLARDLDSRLVCSYYSKTVAERKARRERLVALLL